MNVDGAAGELPGVEVFDAPAPRRRFAPADVLRLVTGLVLVVAGLTIARWAQSTVEGIEEDVLRAVSRLPDTFESLVLSLAQLITSLIPAIALVVLLVRRHWRVAGLLLLSSLAAGLAMAVTDAIVLDRDLGAVLDELRAADSATTSAYPSSQVLASTTAVVTVAAPWLSRRWKRALWWGLGGLVVLRLMAVALPAFDLLVAVGVGTVVGSAVLVLFGAPSIEPRPEELVDAVTALGIRPVRIERRSADDGLLRYVLVAEDGAGYDVALRTPDERDAELFGRIYRRLRLRASEVEPAYATLKRRIEHEALVLTLAERAGVRVPPVAGLGTTGRGSAFLLTSPLATRPVVDDDVRSATFLASLWGELRVLHDAGIAHRRISLEVASIDESGRAWLDRFDDAQTAPSARERARDVAALLTESAVVAGAPAAVASAVAVLGPERVAPAVRMLQPLALAPSTRARAKQVDGLLDDLRAEVERATGEPGLELEELERLKPRTLLVIGASTLAFYSLLPQLASLSDTIDSFGDADLRWMAAVVGVSVLTFAFAAVSLQGAVAEPLPVAASLRSQVAARFAGLVGPAGAGGFALQARFLERAGVARAEAGASVAVNTIGGFAVHMALLVGFVLWTGQSGIGGFSFPDSSTLLLVLAVLLALLGVGLAIGPVRRRFLVPAWVAMGTGAAQIGEVFRRPARVAGLFGGSLGITLTFLGAMACSVEAFGGGLSFAQIGAAYLVAVAIATVAPTPGGLGALESALIAGFTGFGLASGVAVSSVLTFRLITFWLPILPGWLAVGWMQRHDEL